MKILKIFILVTWAAIISFNATAQFKPDVPKAVIASFSSGYPQVHTKNWSKHHSEYAATFKLDGKKCQAFYAKDGNWLSTETDIRGIKNLAPDIKVYLRNSKYASYHIDRIADVVTPSQKMLLVEVDNNSGNMEPFDNVGSFDYELLYFSIDGNLLSRLMQEGITDPAAFNG